MTSTMLHITLFGTPQFRLDDLAVEGFPTRKSQALLIYLICNRRPFARDQLMAMFWPDKPDVDARNNLRRVLSALRRQFGGYLASDRQTVAFLHDASVWVDVNEFEAAQRLFQESASIAAPDVERLERSFHLYTDEFLAGFHLPEAPAFEDWMLIQREHLRERALRWLSLLTAHFIETRQLRRGLATSRQLLTLEPWHEAGYQQRMILLAWNGERSAALQQYELCRRMLADEFGLEPDEETTDLYERIKAGEFDPAEPVGQFELAPTWGAPGLEEVPVQPFFVGREAELARLREAHQADRCAVITVLGVGGAGKTALVAHYARSVAAQPAAPPVDRVLWASLLNAPPLRSLLRIWLRSLSAQALLDPTDDVDELLAQLFAHLRAQRCLLVLDNLESIMQGGGEVGRFRDGYAEYGLLLQRLVELPHAGTLILTSRELPSVLARDAERAGSAVRTLQLAGLSAGSGAALLAHAGLAQASPSAAELVQRYSGNPLALKLVADTVRDLYGGDMEAFLAQGTPVFGDIRAVLDVQVARLTALEREILGWLAIHRVPVAMNRVLDLLVGPLDRHGVFHAINTLLHTSLVERESEEDGPIRVTLQNVVMEYMTGRLLSAFNEDLAGGTCDTLRRYPLVMASAAEHVQETQRRLLLQPVASQARAAWGKTGAIERLRALLDTLRRDGRAASGYAGANLLHLLLALDADLRGLDLSEIAVRQADLRSATLAEVNFSGADLGGSIFASTIGAVTDLAVSPDGHLFAAAGSDGAVYLWRCGDFEPVNTLRRHTIVMSVEFSADGNLLLSSGLDGLICLWDVPSGRLLRCIETPERPVIRAALHPDGVHVATAGTDEMIRIWNWQRGEERAAMRAPSLLTWLAYSPDGGTLASVGDERTICLWDGYCDTLRETRRGHDGKVQTVAFHPGGETFATGGEDGRICLWAFDSAAPLQVLDQHADFVLSIAYSPDGALLASCGSDQTARIWDLASGAARHILTGHNGWVNAVAFSADSRTLLTGGYDQSVRVWDTGNGQMEHVIKGHLRWVDYVTFSNDGRMLASCSLNGPVRVWEVATGQLLHTLRGPEAATRILAFSRTGDLLAAAGDDRVIHVWDVRSGAPVRMLRGHNGSVRNLLFVPDGSRLLSASHDGTLCIWEIATGLVVRRVVGVNAISRLALGYEPETDLFAYATQDHSIVVESAATGANRYTLRTDDATPAIVAFDPTGRWLACGTTEGAVLLYELAGDDGCANLRFAIPATGAPIWRVLFSPDSSTVAWIASDLTIRIFDLERGASSRLLPTYFGAFCLGFSSDGRQIVTDGPDHTVLVHDIESGALRHTLRGHGATITCIEVSRQGDFIASSSVDGTVRLWDLHTGACLATLEAQGPYAGMTITGVSGITRAQVQSLLLLGARE